MYKITLDLTPESIDNAIASFKQLQDQIEKETKSLLRFIANQGVTIAKSYVQNIDTGATVGSIHANMYYENNKAVIIAGANAIWLEFGTGVRFNQPGSYPLPLPNGVVDIGQYGKGKGSRQNGWVYPISSSSAKYELKDKNGKGLGIAHTYGIPANKFMYQTLKHLEKNAPKWAKSLYEGLK